jgi:hypothetical protein
MLAQILDYLVLQQNAGNLDVLTVRDSYTQFTGQKAVVTFSFDDSFVTDYTVAYPMFIDRGIAGTSFIIGGICGCKCTFRLPQLAYGSHNGDGFRRGRLVG